MKNIFTTFQKKIIDNSQQYYRNIRYGKYHPIDCINASFLSHNIFSKSFLLKDSKHEDIKKIYHERFTKLSKEGLIDEDLKNGKAKPKITNPNQSYVTYGEFEDSFSVYLIKNVSIYGKWPLAFFQEKVIGDCTYQNFSRDRLFKQLYYNQILLKNSKKKFNILKSKNINNALILTSRWNHFSHFISEHIYKIRYLRKAISKKEFNNIKFIVEKNFPKWKIDLLISIGVEFKNLIFWDENDNFEVKNFYITSYPEPNYDNLIWLKKSVKDFLKIKGGNPNKKIYISRNKLSTSPRKILNERNLISYLRENNFEIIYPEKLSFYEQVEIFSKASIIIGPHGAGHINHLFSNNCKIIEFQGNITRLALGFFTTAKVLGFEWKLLLCEENLKTGSITINIDKLDNLLKQFQN